MFSDFGWGVDLLATHLVVGVEDDERVRFVDCCDVLPPSLEARDVGDNVAVEAAVEAAFLISFGSSSSADDFKSCFHVPSPEQSWCLWHILPYSFIR